MHDDELPAALRDLIRWHLASMDHVELLVLLHRTAPKTWSVNELAHELHLPVRTVAECLESLVAGELAMVVRDSHDRAATFRFAPGTDTLDHAVELLAREYDERPVALVTAVRSRPSVVLQSFADAFRVRRRS